MAPHLEPDVGLTKENTFTKLQLSSCLQTIDKIMSTQLDIVHKLKESLETGNPEIAAPFMADDFTHQALPAQYVPSAASASGAMRPMLILNDIRTGWEPRDALRINGRRTSLG